MTLWQCPTNFFPLPLYETLHCVLQSAVAQSASVTTPIAAHPLSNSEAMGRKEVGEDTTVQQILMPPDTDFLSSFYEAAQVRECICIAAW